MNTVSQKKFRPVAIIGGSRTPFTKSMTHYSDIGNKELMTAVLKDLVKNIILKMKFSETWPWVR